MIFSITLPEHEAPRTASQSYTFTASDCMETSDVCWRSVYHSVSDQELTLIGQISKSAVWKSRLKTLWCLQWKQRTPGGDVRDSFSHICKWTTDNNLINDNNYHLQPNNSFVFNAAKFFSLFFFFYFTWRTAFTNSTRCCKGRKHNIFTTKDGVTLQSRASSAVPLCFKQLTAHCWSRLAANIWFSFTSRHWNTLLARQFVNLNCMAVDSLAVELKKRKKITLVPWTTCTSTPNQWLSYSIEMSVVLGVAGLFALR